MQTPDEPQDSIGPALDVMPWTSAQLAELREIQRAEGVLFARRAVLLAEMARACDRPEAGWGARAPWASMLMDAAGTLRVHQSTVGTWVDDALQLTGSLPRTAQALLDGEVTVEQTRRLLLATRSASPDVAAEVEAELLPRVDGLMPAQVERLAKAAVLLADPQTAEREHALSRDQRSVDVRPLPDGMMEIRASTDAVQGRQTAIGLESLEERSRHEQADALGLARNDTGRLGRRPHRRADLFAQLPELCEELLDLLDGVLPALGEPSVVERWFPLAHRRALSCLVSGAGGPGGPTGAGPGREGPGAEGPGSGGPGTGGPGTGGPAGRRRRTSRRRGRKRQVRIDVPAATCTRGEGGIGWVEQYGPIAASQVLALLPTAELRRGLVDPETGRLLALDDPGAVPDLSEALEQARQHLADERERQRQWTRERFEEEHRWDGRTERRATPRPPRTPEDVAAEREQVELLLRWREQQRPPERDPESLDQLQRALLALTLADRSLPPDDPSRRVESQHDPSPDLAELVRQRDETCDGPGCTAPSRSSDLDHHHRYDPVGDAAGLGGTRTSAASLVPRSERCHQARHHPSWSVVSHGDGSSTWTSPTGARYLTRGSLAPLLPRPKPWQPTTGRGWQGPATAYDEEPLLPDSPEG